MEYSTLWWLAAGVAVAAELLSGTFYLLMLALGMAAAGLAANLGAPAQAQMLVAAGVGGGDADPVEHGDHGRRDQAVLGRRGVTGNYAAYLSSADPAGQCLSSIPLEQSDVEAS